jgi:hypothetical protein
VRRRERETDLPEWLRHPQTRHWLSPAEVAACDSDDWASFCAWECALAAFRLLTGMNHSSARVDVPWAASPGKNGYDLTIKPPPAAVVAAARKAAEPPPQAGTATRRSLVVNGFGPALR